MKILIAYDGSECADEALVDLRRGGFPDKTEAIVLTAVDVFIPSKPDVKDLDDPFVNYVPHGVKLARERAREAFAEAEILASKAAEKVREMFPRWEVKPEAHANTPHWAIIFKAEEWKPDLIIVGSHGRSALGRAVLGSVSQKVLYEAACSVRIARESEKNADEPLRIILGTDGSPDSEAMVEEVAARNWQKGTEVKIITAVETFDPYETELEAQIDRIRDLQTATAKRLSEAGLIVTQAVTEEDPKSFLVRQAEAWGADCIFLGAKGHRFFERFFLGSVSSSVAARAQCSVEVVRSKK